MPFAAQAAATKRSARGRCRAHAARERDPLRERGARPVGRAVPQARDATSRAEARWRRGRSRQASWASPPRSLSRAGAAPRALRGPARATRARPGGASPASPRAARSRGRGCRTSRCRGSRTAGPGRGRTGRAGTAPHDRGQDERREDGDVDLSAVRVAGEAQSRTVERAELSAVRGPCASTSGVAPPASPASRGPRRHDGSVVADADDRSGAPWSVTEVQAFSSTS